MSQNKSHLYLQHKNPSTRKGALLHRTLLRKLLKIDGTNIKILFFMRVRLTPLSFQNSYGSVKERVSEPILTWSILDQAEPFKPGGKSCNLCLTEKYHIITSELNLLNKRSELTSKCRHENKFLIKNFVTIEDTP